MTSPSSPARPTLNERPTYVPLRRPETFMVPLLKAAIETGIAKHAPAPAANAPQPRALDIGCGAQPFRSLLESRRYRYFGLDTQAAPGTTLDFLAAIDQPLPPTVLAAGPFDFILCTEVLEHVADWHTAFTNFHQLLAPGGRILLTAPHFYILHEEPYDFWRPTLHAFQAYAREAKLNCLESVKLGDAWDIVGTILGSCRFDPATPTLGRSILAKTLWRLRNLAFKIIARPLLRSRATFTGPTYLSNFVVLQRPL